MDIKGLSNRTAERLKSLREEQGLSHEKLSKALNETYEISISKDILIQYEKVVIDETEQGRKYANKGMSVEKLRCLADFYGVSTDYLLGLTDTRNVNKDVQVARETTGLSEKAILQLQEWREEWTEHIEIISKLIAFPGFDDFLHHVREYRLLAYGKFTPEEEEIREIIQQEQERAQEYLGSKECSPLVTAFVALKSNLNNRDISEFYLHAAQKEIGYAIEHLDETYSL